MSEHPIEAIPCTIIQPFPHCCGIGKVLQTKDLITPIVNLDDEENDVGDNRNLAAGQ